MSISKRYKSNLLKSNFQIAEFHFLQIKNFYWLKCESNEYIGNLK